MLAGAPPPSPSRLIPVLPSGRCRRTRSSAGAPCRSAPSSRGGPGWRRRCGSAGGRACLSAQLPSASRGRTRSSSRAAASERFMAGRPLPSPAGSARGSAHADERPRWIHEVNPSQDFCNRAMPIHSRMTHDFAFSGLIACARCGCSVVGEIKKQKYIHYHRTGYADKCRGEPATCRRKYVREEVLEQQFTAMLGQLRFNDEVLDWVREALHASHADKGRASKAAIARLQAEHARLGERISATCVDKLDGSYGGRVPWGTAGQVARRATPSSAGHRAPAGRREAAAAELRAIERHPRG
jgi:hypothetical protein